MPKRGLEAQVGPEIALPPELAVVGSVRDRLRRSSAHVAMAVTALALVASFVTGAGLRHQHETHSAEATMSTHRSPFEVETHEHVDPPEELDEILRRIRRRIRPHVKPSDQQSELRLAA